MVLDGMGCFIGFGVEGKVMGRHGACGGMLHADPVMAVLRLLACRADGRAMSGRKLVG